MHTASAHCPPANATGYTVAVTPPAGSAPTYDFDGIATPSTAVALLTPAQNRTDIDFGYRGTASIAGNIWRDDDANAAKNGTEPNIAGLTVTLTGTDSFGNTVTRTTTTDANGNYIFSNLLAGNYTVTVTTPSGLLNTYDGGTGNNNNTPVVLAAGATVTAIDFGYIGLGSVGDRVWHDRDGDRVQDAGEPGLSGRIITLTGIDVFGNAVNLTRVTGANGIYLFPDLPPSDAAGYTVTVTNPPAGTVQTYDLDGVLTPDSAIVTVDPSQNRRDVDFGYQGTGAIGDAIWIDSDGNGIKDLGEAGISGITVMLTGTDAFGNPINFTTITDANGNYLFNHLLGGTYTVTVTPPEDMINTYHGTSDTTDVQTVTLRPGQRLLTVDFGYQPIPTPPTEPEPIVPVTPICNLGCVPWQVYHTNQTGDWEIFRLGDIPGNPDANVNLTQNSADDVEPSRSPDGQWLAFSSNRDGNWEIYVTPTDGDTSQTQRVTYNTIAVDSDPAWGPTGYIAFESTRDGNWELYMVDVETGLEYRLTDDESNDLNANWSPDGSSIIFQSDRSGTWQLYRMNVATRQVILLSDGTSSDIDPQYSADGQRIVFRSIGENGRSILTIMSANGRNRYAISDADGDATNAAWSPDTRLIAYQSDVDGDLDIYIYDVGSRETRQLTDNDIPDYATTWLCDSTEVLFTSDIMENPDIFQAEALPITAPAIDVEETAMQLTDHPAADIYPQSAPSEEDASQEGRLPSFTQAEVGHTIFLQPDVTITEEDLSLERDDPWRPIFICEP